MINVRNEELEFHLQTKNTSYLMKVLPSGHLSHVYYGKRMNHHPNFKHLSRSFSLELGSTTTYSSEDLTYSMNMNFYEFPTSHKGDYRESAIDITNEFGFNVVDLKYIKHEVYSGKKEIQGLPSTYANTLEDCDTLDIYLKDSDLDLTVILSYSVFINSDVITRRVELINGDLMDLVIEKLMSFSLDYKHSNFELLTLDGAWIRERHLNRRKLHPGVVYIDSKKGVSSSDHNPFLSLVKQDTNEHVGDCYGFAFVYSGDHQSLVEVSPFDSTRVQMGINPSRFKWHLEKKSTFCTPEVVMTYSDQGLNGMSQNFHSIIQHHLVRGPWKYKERPILINNWEATYFDFNEKKLLDLAKSAQQLGMELFVLDDGWFGNRKDDKRSLGDWVVNTKKIPSGLNGLADKINKIGLEFGLWFEPEMISIDSDLYRNHPEYAIGLPNKTISLGRHQALLDLSNPSVCEYIYETLDGILSSANITYVKWDMNRNFSDPYSNYLKPHQQSELTHRYYLGLYSILEKLNKKFPHILFESCASGGNRFDLGMLYYMPQTWTSDNTDAVERTKIQYGTSLVFPPSVMGAHVSGNVNHQVMRKTPIESRFNVASFGLLGYELDLTKLSTFDKKVIKNQVEFYKKYRSTLQFGTFYRMMSPNTSNDCLWITTSKDQEQALFMHMQILNKPNPGLSNHLIVGLNKDYFYTLTQRTQYIKIATYGELINTVLPVKIKENGIIHTTVDQMYLFKQEIDTISSYGEEFMNYGYQPKHLFTGTGFNEQVRLMTDFESRIYVFQRTEEE